MTVSLPPSLTCFCVLSSKSLISASFTILLQSSYLWPSGRSTSMIDLSFYLGRSELPRSCLTPEAQEHLDLSDLRSCSTLHNASPRVLPESLCVDDPGLALLRSLLTSTRMIASELNLVIGDAMLSDQTRGRRTAYVYRHTPNFRPSNLRGIGPLNLRTYQERQSAFRFRAAPGFPSLNGHSRVKTSSCAVVFDVWYIGAACSQLNSVPLGHGEYSIILPDWVWADKAF